MADFAALYIFYLTYSAVCIHLSLHHVTAKYTFLLVLSVHVFCHCPGDPHVASAAVWGAVQSESSHRQTHLFCHLENHTRGKGMPIQIPQTIKG